MIITLYIMVIATTLSGDWPESLMITDILLSNAVIHEYDGGKTLTIHIAVFCLDGICVLEFPDNGKGMTADHLFRIFDPFFTPGRNNGAHGLGLSIA
ncbi:MAG: sensor histidine kinase [Spirochaetota bacterium]